MAYIISGKRRVEIEGPVRVEQVIDNSTGDVLLRISADSPQPPETISSLADLIADKAVVDKIEGTPGEIQYPGGDPYCQQAHVLGTVVFEAPKK